MDRYSITMMQLEDLSWQAMCYFDGKPLIGTGTHEAQALTALTHVRMSAVRRYRQTLAELGSHED